MSALDGEYGYEWREITTPAELAGGQRRFMQGLATKPQVEQRSIITPHGKRYAWVDEDNQEHWAAEGAEVPTTWRRIYVEVAR